MNLETITYSTDTGTEAIEKLDRNQRVIKTNVESQTQQINVLSKYVYTTDDPDLLDNGFWYCLGEKNPTNDIYCIECRKTPINGYAYQIAIYPFVASLIYVRRQAEGTWSEWCQIATTDKTDELTQQINGLSEIESIDLSNYLLNGITNRITTNATRKGNSASLTLQINLNGFDLFSSFTNCILYLPSHFKPKNELCDLFCATDLGICSLKINLDGSITRGNVAPSSIPTWLVFTISGYVCEGGTE